MTTPSRLGGVIHTYRKFDPQRFPSPRQPEADLVSGAFEHLLMYGSMRDLTDEELARAVRLDPSQIAGLGPSIEALRHMLEERKRKILERYETRRVQKDAAVEYQRRAKAAKPPKSLRGLFHRAVKEEQLRDLEHIWYQAGDDRSQFAAAMMPLIGALGNKYQIDELAEKYEFTGRERLTIDDALEVKEELETIDRLLKQLEEAEKTAQIGIIDMDALAEFAEPGDIEQLGALRQQIEDLMREMAERQGLERNRSGSYELTPKAYRIFQSKLLERIFSELDAARSGRHTGPIVGEGAVEMQATRPYEFGDAVANMDIPASFVNALLRSGPGTPVRLTTDDIEIHRTRNTPKCATSVLMDMSGSMRYDGQYINVKRMALALDGLMRREYPGDFLQFIEVYSFAKVRHSSEIVNLMPKPVTIFDPFVRRKADMSNPDLSELQVPPHFTNIQHGLNLARKFLSLQNTPNRQIILITDGLPTAHFEAQMLYLLYPPDSRTEEATMREARLCHREGITINIFLLSGWSQSEEDIRFAYRMAESTKGRVFFSGGRDLDRYVVWDYLKRRRDIVS
jgi:uncharacterized protein with von Willebrand factor type A (vWA) domain